MKKKANSKSAKRAEAVKSVKLPISIETSTAATETAKSEQAPSPAPAAKAPMPSGSGRSTEPLKPTRKSAAKKTARRYSPESKTEILDFVRDHDATNGRGGKSAAVRKFGVSALTLSKWLKASKSGGKGVKAGGGRREKAPKDGKRGGRAGSGIVGLETTLRRMLEIRNQIGALTTEFEALKARI